MFVANNPGTLTLAGMSAALVAALIALAAEPRPPPSHKGDRLAYEPRRPVEEPVRAPKAPPPVTLIQDDPRAAAPPPVELPIQVPARPVSAPKPENVCSRHGGWKVITDGGRSWRCAYGR
jgi:hypothetical protein